VDTSTTQLDFDSYFTAIQLSYELRPFNDRHYDRAQAAALKTE